MAKPDAQPAPVPRRRRRPVLVAAVLLVVAGLAGLAGLVVIATSLRAQAPRRPIFAHTARPLIFAHRGGAGEGPESTVPTMLDVLARNPGVAIELDVRQTRDGAIVVLHDATVDRTTNGTGRVADLTLAEVQALDAGHCATPGVGSGTARRGACSNPAGGFPFRGKGYRIPTLDEVLEKLPAGTILGIEVKAAGFEAALAARLRRWGGLDRLVIGSADDDVGARLRELLPEAHHYFPVWAAARLAAGAKLAAGRLSHPDYDVLAIPKSAGGVSLATPGLIATARRLSVMVAYFIIDDEEKMAELFRLGADAIMTDYPSRARAVAARLPVSRAQTP